MKWFAPIFLLIVLLAAVTLLNKPIPQAEIVVASSSAVQTFNPQRVTWSSDIRISYALYEGLCSVDPHTMQTIPGVAERWELSEDRKTYTFYLRNNAKWSNGDPVTAHDFATSYWHVLLQPDVISDYVKFLHFIRGAKAFSDYTTESYNELKKLQDAEGAVSLSEKELVQAARKRVDESKVKFKASVGVKVIDDLTLQIELEKPKPYFLEVVAFPTLMPLHAASLIDAHSEEEKGQRVWHIDPATLLLTKKREKRAWENLIVNGPYTIGEWEFKGYLFLKANPNYWREGFPKAQSIRLDYIESQNLQFINYTTDAVDVLLSIDGLNYQPDLMRELEEGKRDDLHKVSRFGTYYLVINNKPEADGKPNPLANPVLRKALAMAVDKEQLVKNVTRMNQPVASTFVPPNIIPNYKSPKGVQFDPEGARTLLAEAGYPDGKGLPTLRLVYNTGGSHEDNMLAIAGFWEKHLNIKVTAEPIELSSYSAFLKKGNFHIARLGWFGDYSDPTTFLDLFMPDNGNNRMGHDDPAFTALMKQAALTLDPIERLKILSKAETIVMDETLPMIPIYHYTNTYVHNKNLKGISLHPRGMQLYSHLEKTK